jgi:hypothetical protein
VNDMRQSVFNDVDIFLDEFDWLGFRAAAQQVYQRDIKAHCRAVRDLALKFGVNVSLDWPEPVLVDLNNNAAGGQSSGVGVSKKTEVFDPFVELGLVQGHEISRGIRNNNPGNIEHVEANQWLGLDTPPSDGRYCRFVSPQLAIRALVLLLLNYQSRHRLKTVTAIIERYAPRQDNNATQAYIRYVCEQLRVKPKEAISVRDFRTAQNLITAIIYFENGMQPYPDELIAEGIALAGLATNEEKAVGQTKPVIQSTEQVAAGSAAAGTAGLTGLEWLKNQITENQNTVVEGLSRVEDSLSGVTFLGWVQVVILLGVLGSIWYLAWRRGEASFLGIR